MKTIEVKENSPQSQQESAKIIEAFGKETEQIIAKACDTAKHAAEMELEKALREYEQKAKQIVLKIREDAKVRTAEIASRLSEAIILGIEKSSAEAVASSVAEFNKRAEAVTQNLTSGKAQAEPEKAAANARVSPEMGIVKDLAGVAEDKGNGHAQASEEFEQWLMQ